MVGMPTIVTTIDIFNVWYISGGAQFRFKNYMLLHKILGAG